MTLEAMQQHESVSLHHSRTDYRRQGVVQFVLELVSGSTVLDMRCLEGDLSVALAKEGKEVTSLDGFEGAVEMTNAHAKRSGIEQDLAQLWNIDQLHKYVGEKRFDSVICLDLLNHVQSDRDTLKEIFEVMSPGGQLILLVSAFEALLGKRDESLGHLRRYSKARITGLLSEFGFRTELCRYWNALALPAYILFESLLKLRVSDRVRYAGANSSSSILGPLLRFWYSKVENRVSPPFGLSLFVVARKER